MSSQYNPSAALDFALQQLLHPTQVSDLFRGVSVPSMLFPFALFHACSIGSKTRCIEYDRQNPTMPYTRVRRLSSVMS